MKFQAEQNFHEHPYRSDHSRRSRWNYLCVCMFDALTHVRCQQKKSLWIFSFFSHSVHLASVRPSIRFFITAQHHCPFFLIFVIAFSHTHIHSLQIIFVLSGESLIYLPVRALTETHTHTHTHAERVLRRFASEKVDANVKQLANISCHDIGQLQNATNKVKRNEKTKKRNCTNRITTDHIVFHNEWAPNE